MSRRSLQLVHPYLMAHMVDSHEEEKCRRNHSEVSSQKEKKKDSREMKVSSVWVCLMKQVESKSQQQQVRLIMSSRLFLSFLLRFKASHNS